MRSAPAAGKLGDRAVKLFFEVRVVVDAHGLDEAVVIADVHDHHVVFWVGIGDKQGVCVVTCPFHIALQVVAKGAVSDSLHRLPPLTSSCTSIADVA